MRKADNLPPSCAVVTKSGNLNFLELSGPLRVCNRTALQHGSYLCFPDIYVNKISNANGQGLVIIVISNGNENFQADADTIYSNGHMHVHKTLCYFCTLHKQSVRSCYCK